MALLPLLGFASIPFTSTPLCPRRIRDVENILGGSALLQAAALLRPADATAARREPTEEGFIAGETVEGGRRCAGCVPPKRAFWGSVG